MDSTAMWPPPTAPPQAFGVYAPPPASSFPVGSTPTFADYAGGTNVFIPPGDYSRGGPSHGFTPSMGAHAQGGQFGYPDWDAGSFSLSELDADIIGPSQTHDAPPPQIQEDAFTTPPEVVPRPTRPHRSPDALTYSEGHIPRRARGGRNKRPRAQGQAE